MPTALTLTDITNVSIDITRSTTPTGFFYSFKTTDNAVTFGTIYDNANVFSDGSTSIVKALKIVITEDTESININDMDFITITGSGGTLAAVSPLKVWLPALSGESSYTLYADTNGNTWYNEELTSPAGGVSVFDDILTLVETFLDATEHFNDALSLSDTIGNYEWQVSVEDILSIEDTLGMILSIMTLHLNDSLFLSDSVISTENIMTFYLNDDLFLSDSVILDISGDFSEDSQTDLIWVEV